jgi:uncharacterized membrane protein
MDTITSAASPAEWWMLAKMFWFAAAFFIVGAFLEGPPTRWYRRWKHQQDQDWRQVPPPNWRSSRGGREYW